MAADIRHIVGRLRPDAEWRWKGGDPTDITQLRWDDLVQVEPTQVEIDAEQIVFEAEEVVRENTNAGQKSKLTTGEGKLFDDLSETERRALLERLCALAGVFNGDGTIRNVDLWGDPI